MKRLVTLLLAAGLMLGGASYSNANAVELTVGGNWQFAFGWYDDSLLKHDGKDNFYAHQRIRPEFNFVADENLSAHLQFEIGGGEWGNKAWGMGADSTSAIKFRLGFVDWVVPGLGAKVRMGMQNFELPTYTKMGDLVGFDDVAGIVVNQPLSDNLGMTLFWVRPYNGDIEMNDDVVDAFGATATYKDDGFKVTPKLVLAKIGGNALEVAKDANNKPIWPSVTNYKAMYAGLLPLDAFANIGDPFPGGDTAWWAGLTAEVTMFDPFTLAFDFMYGSVDFGTDEWGYDLKRAGWVANATAMYKLDFASVGLGAWYGSGDDSNRYNGSERLPYIYQDTNGINRMLDDSGWSLSTRSKTQDLLCGTWGVQVRVDNMSFLEGLKHTFRATYARGNNDKYFGGYYSSMKDYNVNGNTYLTEEDSAWALQFDSVYQIYKNLNVSLNLAYVKFDFDEGLWGSKDGRDDKFYECAVQMQYKF